MSVPAPAPAPSPASLHPPGGEDRPALLQGEGLPRFEAITPEQVRAHIPGLIAHLEAELSALEGRLQGAQASDEPLGWGAVLDPLQRLEERLRWSWGVVSHLNGVCNSPELREAHASQQAAVVAFGNRSGQSLVLYRALKRLHEQGGLDATQERILAAELRAMELRGVGLEGKAQAAFNAASQELAELSTRFGNQVLDATNGWSLLLRQQAEVEGLPESLRALLAAAARQAGDEAATPEEGPWLVGLDFPRYGPFLQYSARRDLRERVYRAFISRASGAGDGD
ncbi:MAG: M3 family peptidase, partial [Cyanobium sp.]